MIKIGATYSLPVPAGLQRFALEIGGRNRHGDPNYRLAWGWERLEPKWGFWTDYDASANMIRRQLEIRLEPKYSPEEFFYLERWRSPEEIGSPEKWAREHRKAVTALFGAIGEPVPDEALSPPMDYPSRGDYVDCWRCSVSNPDFKKPGEGIPARIFAWPHKDAVQLGIQLHRLAAQKRRKFGALADVEIRECEIEGAERFGLAREARIQANLGTIDQFTKPYAGAPFVTVPQGLREVA